MTRDRLRFTPPDETRGLRYRDFVGRWWCVPAPGEPGFGKGRVRIDAPPPRPQRRVWRFRQRWLIVAALAVAFAAGFGLDLVV